MAATETSTRAAGALDGLYRRHVGEVYRYAYAVLGNHADAEDVTQTTFVNAFRALERGERPREASHWLLAIAHNIVRQRWRQAAARPSEVELHDNVGDDRSEEPAPLDELVRALQRIPPAQREAIVMRELEDRSYREISEILGISTSALETLLFRARRSLAEEMENLVTCDRAELSLSRQADGRLSRKERRRLEDHLEECAACAARAKSQHRTRRTFKGLAVLPLPLGLTLFRDLPAASAASLPTIGLAGGAVAGTAVTGSTVGGAVGGSIVGGAALKVAAAVAAVGVASGVGYKGVEAAHERLAPPGATPSAQTSADRDAAKPSSARSTRANVPARGNSVSSSPGGAKRGVVVGRAKPGPDRLRTNGTAKKPSGPRADVGGPKANSRARGSTVASKGIDKRAQRGGRVTPPPRATREVGSPTARTDVKTKTVDDVTTTKGASKPSVEPASATGGGEKATDPSVDTGPTPIAPTDATSSKGPKADKSR